MGLTTGWAGEWLVLEVIRLAWTGLSISLALFAWRQFRAHSVVPRPICLFSCSWSVTMALLGLWLITADTFADSFQSIWLRAGIGASFAGSLAGSLWMLFYFRRTPHVSDAVLTEVIRHAESYKQ